MINSITTIKGFACCGFAAAMVVLLLASCSTSDDVAGTTEVTEPAEPAPVVFNTDISIPSSRATIGSIDNLDALKASGEGFGVFAYLTDAQNYATKFPNAAAFTSFSEFFMYNQQVTWGVQYVDEKGNVDPSDDEAHYDWVYRPLKYWPNSTNNATNRYISFFAYAPYVEEEGASKGITGYTNSTDRQPHIVYEIADGNEQVDLLYANCVDAKRNGNGLITVGRNKADTEDSLHFQKIPLTFHHALAALDIYVQRVYDEPVYTGKKPAGSDFTKLFISKLELASAVNGESGLQTGGRLDLETGEWTSVGTTWDDATDKKLTYTESMFDDYVKGTTSTDPLVIRDIELGKFSESTGVDEEERTLIKNAMPQVFLPRSVTLIPKITFSMVTHDDDLAIDYYTDLEGKKYSRIVNEVTGNTMTIDFQAGKRYKMLIRVGVEHVSFEVLSIVDWDFPLRYNPDVVSPYTDENIGHRVDEADE